MQSVKILSTNEVTHNVVALTVEKPVGYTFEPGEATEVAIDAEGWRGEKRPFTFTSLPGDQTLEFIIKVYEDHNAVTKQIGTLKEGNRLLIDDPWGAIHYKGKGCFIAGGAGITPFIAIFRDLQRKGVSDSNQLLFSNLTERDIILQDELQQTKNLSCVFTVTDQPTSPHAHGFIDKKFLETHVSDFDQHFYVCGPGKMIDDVSEALESLGAKTDAIVFEQ